MANMELKETFNNLTIITEKTGNKTIYKFSGPFQEMNDVRGNKNKNGRIYTKKLWERALADEGFQERLKSRRMLGELDHPCLTNREFRVLTSAGWKEFVDIKVGDMVWSRVKGKAVLSDVNAIVNEPYEGLVYHVHGRSMDTTYTPAHKFVTVKRPDRVSADTAETFATIADIAGEPCKFAHSAIPTTAIFCDEGKPTQVSIPGVETNGTCKNDVTKPLILDSGLFAAFMGIYLSEGYICAGNYDILISQTNAWSKEFIYSEVLSKFPSCLVWRETRNGYALSDKRLQSYCKKFGNAYNRYVPEEIKNLSSADLRELIFWFCIGDGRMVSVDDSLRNRTQHIPYSRQDLFSVSERLVRDLHECLVLCGGAGSISSFEPEDDYGFAGRTIKAANKVPLWQLHISHSKNIWLDPRFLKIDKEYHKGNIYCLTTTHGSFYMEQNGHAFWTGNSDDGQIRRTSHIVTDIKPDWNSGIIEGQLELLNHDQGDAALVRALVEQGVQLCVSSRGFGDFLKDGCTIDPETYKAITWDVVLDPSVPIAMLNRMAESVNKDLPNESKSRSKFVEAGGNDKEENKQKTITEEKKMDLNETTMKLMDENKNLSVAAAKNEVNLSNMKDLVTSKNERIQSLEGQVKTLNEKAEELDESVASLKTANEKVTALSATIKQYEDIEDRAIKVIESLKAKVEEHEQLGERAADTIESLMETIKRKREAGEDDLKKVDKDVDAAGKLRNWEPDPKKGDELKQLKEFVMGLLEAEETDAEKAAKAAAAKDKDEKKKGKEEDKGDDDDDKMAALRAKKDEADAALTNAEKEKADKEKAAAAEKKEAAEKDKDDKDGKKDEDGEKDKDVDDDDELPEPTPEEKREARTHMMKALSENAISNSSPKK